MLCEMKDILMTWITATTEDVLETYQSWCIFFIFIMLVHMYEEYLHSLTTKLCAVD